MAVGLGQHKQAPFDVEFENSLLVEAGPYLPVPFGQDLPADRLGGPGVGHLPGAAGDREAVVLPGRRARLAVQRVTPVPAQVLLLGSRLDEQVQSGGADDRTDGMNARAAVWPDGGQEGQADAELVKLPAARVRQCGLVPLELGPGGHLADATRLLLTSSVSDPGYA
jgi:hypothetical protein